MKRIDFQLSDDKCYVSSGETLEQSRTLEEDGGGDPNHIIYHLTIEKGHGLDGDFLTLLKAAHLLELKGGSSSLEHFVGVIFRAGVEFGRKNTVG